ncbi:hypothetical protein FS842_000852 [Serendipita sp. 407]|nr:hypothetical protein FRC15_011456 [Serendipita sp. 397]KAG8870456.1 hypothetical protein FRC20_011816 [Serendipita sp. 405]KAG9055897.1 hypothetical protein FS842_000852 [Serendipita sp. 407]
MLWRIKLGFCVWITVLLHLLSRGVYAAYNLTVDDADPAIAYLGTWLKITRSERYMSTTHYTKTMGSYAKFAFTGTIQIHFMGLGNTNESADTEIEIVLDGESQVVDIYRDKGEHLQAILWSSGILDSTADHVIECRKTSDDGGGRDLNVDAFILTIPDAVSSSSRTTIAPTNPSTPSPFSTPTIVNSPNLSRVNVTVVELSTVMSGVAGRNPSSIVWAPPSSMNTIYGPVSTPSSQYNGTIQASVGGLADSNILSKSVIIGIAFGALVLLCLIAVVFFYLGRRRNAPRHVIPLQLHDSSSYDPKGTPEDEQRIDQFVFLGSVQSNLKQGRYIHEAPHQEDLVSHISSGDTRSRSSRIETSFIGSDSITNSSESNSWMNDPPAYTFRPTSGLTSITASGPAKTRHSTNRKTHDISRRQDRYDESGTQ